MVPIGKLKKQSWFLSPEVQKIFSIFKNKEKIKFVGGCIRDSLLNLPIKDIDIAVSTKPQQIIRILKENNIKVLPIGANYGSVLAIINNHSFQITSLRADIKTYGRQATVQFTNNWGIDAKRRDFTINSLYADIDGTLYDPSGKGIDDLKTGNIRFIGNPNERIKEDALRILRFFRFYAFYGKKEPSAKTLLACKKNVNLLNILSKERITYEILRLLSSHSPIKSLRLAKETNVLKTIFPYINDFSTSFYFLQILEKLEDLLNYKPDPFIRLTCLISNNKSLTNILLSRTQKKQFTILNNKFSKFPEQFNKNNCLTLLYNYGLNTFFKLMILNSIKNICDEKKEIKEEKNFCGQLIKTFQQWEKPTFPVKGKDLINLGIPSGPKLGLILAHIEKWWINNNFIPNKKECLYYLKRNNL